MSEDMELVCFQLIANSGAAKSSYMEAVELAKKGDFKAADEKVTEAEECFVQAHKIHADLIQKEAAGEKTELSLLFIHAEDQMAMTEMVQLFSKQLLQLYKQRYNIKGSNDRNMSFEPFFINSPIFKTLSCKKHHSLLL